MTTKKAPNSVSSLSARSPAVEKAFAFLADSLKGSRWSSGDRLPPLKQLAALSHVSLNSMWKALGRAKKEKLVTVTRGGYIIAGSGLIREVPGTRENPGIQRDSLWRSKRDQMTRDIMGGRFSEHGILPSSKELQEAYGICRATVGKITRALADSGIVESYKKKYRIASFKKSYSAHKIILLSESLSSDVRRFANERLEKLAGFLEYECARSNFSTMFISLDLWDSKAASRARSALQEFKNVSGYLFCVPWITGPSMAEQVADLLAWIAARKRPVAILDSGGDFVLPPELRYAGNAAVFRMAAVSAGRQAGAHLARLGHSHCAYVSHVHASEWSKLRLKGLKEAFDAMGTSKNVVPVVSGNVELIFDRDFWLGSLPPADVSRIVSIRSPQGQLDYLEEYSKSGRWPDGRDQSLVEKDISILRKMISTGIDPGVFAVTRDAMLTNISKKRNAIDDLLFSEALSNSECTAWVMANDGIAIKALQFLQKKHVRVPQDISILSFDNTPESFTNKLSTFDFNMNGIMHHLLWFIQRYDGKKARLPGPPVEIEGMVIDRGSTGKDKQLRK